MSAFCGRCALACRFASAVSRKPTPHCSHPLILILIRFLPSAGPRSSRSMCRASSPSRCLTQVRFSVSTHFSVYKFCDIHHFLSRELFYAAFRCGEVSFVQPIGTESLLSFRCVFCRLAFTHSYHYVNSELFFPSLLRFVKE